MTFKKLFVTALFVLPVMSVLALPNMTGVFKSTYKVKADSDLGKAGCAACHTDKKGKGLNPYGKDLAAQTKGGKLTAEMLQKIESLDSDKDGVKNGDELKAGKLPGVK